MYGSKVELLVPDPLSKSLLEYSAFSLGDDKREDLFCFFVHIRLLFNML